MYFPAFKNNAGKIQKSKPEMRTTSKKVANNLKTNVRSIVLLGVSHPKPKAKGGGR